MELQHRLARQAIHIAVSKATEDMKSNAKRSIRNLIDLGLLFSKNDHQKHFFSAAKKVASNPRNPCHSLVARLISDVDNDTIKKVGLNLGYSSLIHGANKRRKRQEDLGISIPWFLIIDISESNPDFFRPMEHLIEEGRELGIYSYIICPHERDHISVLCEIAKRFEECMFVFKVPSGLISEQTAEILGEIHNAMVSVQVASTDFSCETVRNAFRLLKQDRCLYGFHVSYNEDTMKQVTTPEYIHSAIRLGNLVGVYIAENGVSDTCRDAVYTFICNVRGENGQPLITVEWYRDIQNISEKILSGNGYMAINLAERVYCKSLRAKNTLPNALLEILQRRKPCTSS